MSRFSGGFNGGPKHFWIAAGLLGLTACGLTVGPAYGKVAVKMLETNILFGARQTAPSPAAPQLPQLPQLPSFNLPTFNFPSYELPKNLECPTAGPTTFPAEVATTTPTDMPPAGQYRWRVDGGAKQSIAGIAVTIPIVGANMPTYLRRDMQLPPDATSGLPGSTSSFNYTFQTIWDLTGASAGGNGDYWVYTWQVKSNATQTSANGTFVSDPEAGLALKAVDIYKKDFKTLVTSFHPTTGLLLMPLPVVTGTSWTSNAVDPTTGEAQFQGTVGSRIRIDECGDLVEAWEAKGTLSLTGTFALNTNNPGTQTANLEIAVAPQYGGRVEQIQIDGVWFGGLDFVKTTFRAGQLNADPLPAGYK